MNTAQVHYAVDDGVVVLTLDDPSARNALSQPIRDGIRSGLQKAEADDDVKVIVLTGSGEKAFCAGIHLKEMAGAGTQIPPRTSCPSRTATSRSRSRSSSH